MRDTLRRGISQLFISPIHKTYIQLFLLIKLITTFTITSFSSVQLSAIINVSATNVLLVIIATHMCEFCTRDITLQLSSPIYIIYMSTDDSSILLE